VITGIKYLSPTFDHSGYGEASRNCIKSLLGENVPITLQRQAFEQTGPENYGEYGAKLASMVNASIPYTHKIMHCTPEHYVKYIENGVKHVGFIYWETSRVPDEWVTWFNEYVDAQIVCCDYTFDVLTECGVTKPIFKLLPPFDMKDFDGVTPYQLEGVRDDTFVFYSIFQWTERKNPMGLLLAYLTEFSGEEDVILVLKTYRSNTSMEEQNYIRKTIGYIKNELRMKSFPKIFFIGDLLTKDQVLGLHARGDCCVIPSRSEGLAMPHAEAMASGKPVIATRLGGHMEFMNDDNSYLVDYQLSPVYGMPWIPWYRGDQVWAEPNIMQIRKHMRYVYENRDAAKEVGIKARDTIREKLDIKKIGEEYVKILEQI
jgi:glycosyltransferase involved in cell wall biosynthesis